MSVVLVKLVEVNSGESAFAYHIGSCVHSSRNLEVLLITGRLIYDVVVAFGYRIELGGSLGMSCLECGDGVHLLLNSAVGNSLSLSDSSVECFNVGGNIVTRSIAALEVLLLVLGNEVVELAGNSLLGCLNLLIAYAAQVPNIHTKLLSLIGRTPDIESAVYALLGAVVAVGHSINVGIAVELEGKLTCHACGLKYLSGSSLGRGGDGG